MLLALTWAAGNIDAISYFGLGHVFTAMMTGNTVLLGLALAQGEVLAALRSILALVGFSVGVFVGALIVERESQPPDWPAVVTNAIALEAAILGIFAGTSFLMGGAGVTAVTYFLIFLLAIAMGIQSAAVRRLGVPGIATTYLTGTLTSLMVDLLGWLRSVAARLPAERAEAGAGRGASPMPWEQRVGLLAGVVGLYCFGAFVGGVLEIQASPLAPLMPLAAVMLVVVNAFIRQRQRT